MDDTRRFILTTALKLKDGTLIPLWDKGVGFVENDYYGNYYTYKVDKHLEEFHYPCEAIFNVETKTLSGGIEIEIYPDESEYKKVGTSVLYEVNFKQMSIRTISKVDFSECDVEIIRGKNIDKWNRVRETHDIGDNLLYKIKYFKPSYVLDDGTIVKSNNKFYELVSDDKQSKNKKRK